MALVSLFSLAACGSNVAGVQDVDQKEHFGPSMDQEQYELVAPAPKHKDVITDPGEDGGGGGGGGDDAPTSSNTNADEQDDLSPAEDLGN